MSPASWERVKQVFEDAAGCDIEDRAAFVAAACDGDLSVKCEVERLLAEDDRAGSFLEPSHALPGLPAEAHSGALRIGQELSHYEIVQKLGEGGMGSVYRAFDKQLRRSVAIKVLREREPRDSDKNRRLLREARAVSALNHPNIAHIYEVADEQDLRFIVMEFVEGQTLADAIRPGALDIATVLALGSKAASALGEAHAHGIVHRDIKPSNIMMSLRGELKVLDFGLAKVAFGFDNGRPDSGETSLTSPGMLLGTVQYMSPEQFLGRPVDHRTDLFSLGLVLFEMATGHPAFRGSTPMETMDRILHSKPEGHTGSTELDRIIRKCLEKKRGRRYQSAREIIDDIQRLQSGRGTRAWTRRIMLVGAASLIAAVAGGAIYKSTRSTVHGPAQLPQRWNPVGFERIASLGDAAPGKGSYIGNFQPWGINNHADLAFAALLSTGGEGVFQFTRGGLSPRCLLRAGEPAPRGGTLEGGVLAYTAINDSADMAFVFGLAPFYPPRVKRLR